MLEQTNSAGNEGGNLHIDAQGLDDGSPGKKERSISPSEPDMKDCIRIWIRLR